MKADTERKKRKRKLKNKKRKIERTLRKKEM